MTPAERCLRRVVDLAGDLADQIRDRPPTAERRHAAAMLVVATQITELAAIAADHLRHRDPA